MANESPYFIAGSLPFPQGGAGMVSAANDPNALGEQYRSSYKSALEQNQANYQNILSGYQQTLANQGKTQDYINRGYTDMANNIMSTIADTGKSQSQAIQDAYARQSGLSQQQMINSGLGNSTVLASLQRGNLLDKSKADVALANQMAQLKAGYQYQTGQAALNQANQGNMQNTALAKSQLDWMNSVNSQYPNAAAYNDLLKQLGANQQADKNRELLQQLTPKPLAGGGGGGTVSRGSGMPAGFNDRMPTGGGYGGATASVTPFGMGSGMGAGTEQPWNVRNAPNLEGVVGGGSFMNNALRIAGLGMGNVGAGDYGLNPDYPEAGNVGQGDSGYGGQTSSPSYFERIYQNAQNTVGGNPTPSPGPSLLPQAFAPYSSIPQGNRTQPLDMTAMPGYLGGLTQNLMGGAVGGYMGFGTTPPYASGFGQPSTPSNYEDYSGYENY